MNNSDNKTGLNDNFSEEKFDEMDELALSLQKQIKDLDNIPELDNYLADSVAEDTYENAPQANESQANKSQQSSQFAESLSERQTQSLQMQLQNRLDEDPSQQRQVATENSIFSQLGTNTLIPILIGLFFIISILTYWLMSNSTDGSDKYIEKTALSLPPKPTSLLEDDSVTEVVVKTTLPGDVYQEEKPVEDALVEDTLVAQSQSEIKKPLPASEENVSEKNTAIRKIPLIYLEDKQANNSINQVTTDFEEDQALALMEESAIVEPQKLTVEAFTQATANKPVDVVFEHDTKMKTNNQGSVLEKTVTEIAILPGVMPKMTKITPSPVIGNSNRQWINIKGKNFTADTRVILHWQDKGKAHSKVLSRQQTKDQFKFIDVQHLKLYINTGVNEKIWQLQLKNKNTLSIAYHFKVVKPFLKTKSKTKQKPDAKVKAVKVVMAKGTNHYLNKQADNFYTLQLVGSSDQQSILKIMNQHKSYKDLYWYPSLRNGKQWAILMYGSFKSKQQALTVYKKLPKSLALTKPWVRSIKSVKQQIANKFDRSDVAEIKNMLDVSIPVFTTKKSNSQKLLSIEPAKWTFQLISLSSEQAMLDYIKRNKLANKGRYFSRVVNAKTRYTLVYGVYNSKQQAQLELKKLPLTIRQGKPWIRTYADIHKLIGK